VTAAILLMFSDGYRERKALNRRFLLKNKVNTTNLIRLEGPSCQKNSLKIGLRVAGDNKNIYIHQEAGSELSASQNDTIAIYIIHVYWPHDVMGTKR